MKKQTAIDKIKFLMTTLATSKRKFKGWNYYDKKVEEIINNIK